MATVHSPDLLVGKEVFLPYPPPPFNRNLGEDERTDVGEDWLPDLPVVFSGNYHVLVDLTGDSDCVDDNTFVKSPRSGSATPVSAPSSVRSQLSPFGERRAHADEVSRDVYRMHPHENEIPESPKASYISAIGVQGALFGDADGALASPKVATVAVTDGAEEESVTGEQGKQEGQEEDTLDSEHRCGDRSDNVVSKQPDAIMLSSTTPLLASERPSSEAVLGRPRNDYTAEVGFPAEEATTPDGPHIDLQDVTLLRVEGQRETPRGPEYLFVVQMWLQPAAVASPGLVQAFRRDVTRQNRLATLRHRKRPRDDGLMESLRTPAGKKAK